MQTLTTGSVGDRALHIFAVNLAAEDIPPAKENAARTELIARLLGQAPDKPDHAELIAISDLEGLGLAGFLRDGPGIPEDQLSPHAARLDALDGYVLALYPGAFAEPTELEIGAELTLIASLGQEQSDWSDAQPLTSAAATEVVAGKKRPSDAAMSGRVAMVALLVIALLTGLMIWIA